MTDDATAQNHERARSSRSFRVARRLLALAGPIGAHPPILLLPLAERPDVEAALDGIPGRAGEWRKHPTLPHKHVLHFNDWPVSFYDTNGLTPAQRDLVDEHGAPLDLAEALLRRAADVAASGHPADVVVDTYAEFARAWCAVGTKYERGLLGPTAAGWRDEPTGATLRLRINGRTADVPVRSSDASVAVEDLARAAFGDDADAPGYLVELRFAPPPPSTHRKGDRVSLARAVGFDLDDGVTEVPPLTLNILVERGIFDDEAPTTT